MKSFDQYLLSTHPPPKATLGGSGQGPAPAVGSLAAVCEGPWED